MLDEAGTQLLRNALAPERVLITEHNSKEDLLNCLVDVTSDSKNIKDTAALRQAIHEREELMSTGIGLGVGVPHARLGAAKDLVMAVALNTRILPDYESIDGGPVRLIFLVAARKDQQQLYVRVLAAISRLVKNHADRDQLLHANDAEELYKLITSH